MKVNLFHFHFAPRGYVTLKLLKKVKVHNIIIAFLIAHVSSLIVQSVYSYTETTITKPNLLTRL